MDKRREAEYDRLNADHPEWVTVPYTEIHPRYWMYFRDDVAVARAAAYWRRGIVRPLEHLVDRLNRKLTHNEPGLSQNHAHTSDPTQVGTTGRLDVKRAQTGAEHSNERNEK